jgi:hypothetical protein
MLQKIGYSHINSSNTEIKFWGNNLGVDFAIPSRVILENGDIVEAVLPYISFNDGSMVVERWIESNPTTEIDVKVGETIEFRDDKIVVVYNYDLPDIEVFKEHTKNKVATKRWQQEIGGITINNVGYATDRESQTKYTAVHVAISQADPNTWSINWKTNEGFVNLNAQEMMAVIYLVLGHVESCFNKESEFVTTIDSCTTVNEVMTIDIENGWPLNQFTT